MAERLARGFLLTIDYGATARRLYTRERRHGTLAVYARHRFLDRPLEEPGERDITAHVNFSALARAGSTAGMRAVEYTSQAAFLTGLGVREEIAARGARLYPAADTERQTDRGQMDLLRRRSFEAAASVLFDPRGLGGFRVLTQTRRGSGSTAQTGEIQERTSYSFHPTF
jgi:SAM-dependent MidA family methyltransferase